MHSGKIMSAILALQLFVMGATMKMGIVTKERANTVTKTSAGTVLNWQNAQIVWKIIAVCAETDVNNAVDLLAHRQRFVQICVMCATGHCVKVVSPIASVTTATNSIVRNVLMEKITLLGIAMTVLIFCVLTVGVPVKA